MAKRANAPDPTDDDGVRVREPEMPDDPELDELPGFWIGHAPGAGEENIEIQEFGDNPNCPNHVWAYRENLPTAIEALVERAYDEDIDEILERVENVIDEE